MIPELTLNKYKKHLDDGCNEECNEACCFENDKVYHEWASLLNVPAEEGTRKKTRKRKRVNQRHL